MQPRNSTIGHSLEAYLRSRDVVYGNLPSNRSNRISLRPHRRLVKDMIDDGGVLMFRPYKTKGEM